MDWVFCTGMSLLAECCTGTSTLTDYFVLEYSYSLSVGKRQLLLAEWEQQQQLDHGEDDSGEFQKGPAERKMIDGDGKYGTDFETDNEYDSGMSDIEGGGGGRSASRNKKQKESDAVAHAGMPENVSQASFFPSFLPSFLPFLPHFLGRVFPSFI